MKVQNLDLGLKVLILQEGPHRSMKDHIGTMVMFYIRSMDLMQNMTMDLLGSSRDLKGPHILWTLKGTKIWTLNPGSRKWSLNRDQKLVPDYGSIFWTFYRDHFNVVPL